MLLWALAALVLTQLLALRAHVRTYEELFQELHARDLVGDEYRAGWTAWLGSLGCMGFLTKLDREIGFENLTPHELALVRTARRIYILGVALPFLPTAGLLFMLSRS